MIKINGKKYLKKHIIEFISNCEGNGILIQIYNPLIMRA